MRVQLDLRTRLYETHSLEELEQAAAAIRHAGIGTVAICGGDGTVGRSLAALARHGPLPLPRIALLRGGTMNTIARSVGVRTLSPAQRLQRLQTSTPLREVCCSTLAIGDDLGFLFSTGVMYGFLEHYYTAGAGVTTAAQVLLRGMASAAVGGDNAKRLARRFTASLTFDDLPTTGAENFLFIGAGTVQEVGLGFRPFPLAVASARRFHALSYTGSVGTLLYHLPWFAVGRGHRLQNARSIACSEMTVHHEGPLPYALDGDLYESAGPITLRCGPEVRFLV